MRGVKYGLRADSDLLSQVSRAVSLSAYKQLHDPKSDLQTLLDPQLHVQNMHTTAPDARLKEGKHGLTGQDEGAEMTDTNINISGSYRIRQSNGAHVNVIWNQDGNQLSGYASIEGSNIVSNSLEGTVKGEHVDFNIAWSDGITGHYWGDLFEPFSHEAWQGALMGDTKVEATGGWAHWEVLDNTFRGLKPQHEVNTADW